MAPAANVSIVRARSYLAVFTCTTMLFACSSAKDTTTNQEGFDAAESTTADTTNIAPEGVPGGTGDAGSGAGSESATNDSAAKAARAALDTYLDALATNDFSTALRASRDALQSLTVVRSIVHAGNAERGGTTTSSFEERTFEAASSAADEVRFRGRATLKSTVSGASGPPVSTTDRFTDIVVSRGADGWRATDATYNGAALVSSPASASAEAGPVQVTLTGAIAFGGSLAVVVQLVSSGDHTVEVGDDALRIGDEQAPSMAKLVVGGQPGFIYLTYPRRDERPTEWHATLIVDGTDHPISLVF